MPDDERAYSVAVDGPGVTLESVDPVEAMNVAIEYLRLVQRVADYRNLNLKMSGLKAIPGSAGLETLFSNPTHGLEAALLAERYVGGEVVPPRELRTATKNAQKAIAELPQGHFAKSKFRDQVRVLSAREATPAAPRVEYVTLRAEVISVGGTDTPKAKFRAPTEGLIAVHVTEAQAREIGSTVYRLADVSMRVGRNGEGKIDDAALISFVPVPSGDATAAWRAWFRENASQWNDVEDLDGALDGSAR